MDKKRADLQQAQTAIGRLKQQAEESDRLRQHGAEALDALRKDTERQVPTLSQSHITTILGPRYS